MQRPSRRSLGWLPTDGPSPIFPSLPAHQLPQNAADDLHRKSHTPESRTRLHGPVRSAHYARYRGDRGVMCMVATRRSSTIRRVRTNRSAS